MKQLATVPSAIVDNFIQVELAKAGIPAFQVIRLDNKDDMHSNVIGLMRFIGGGEAVFVRGDQAFYARLSVHPTGPEQHELRKQCGDKLYYDGEHTRQSGALQDPVVTYDYTCYSADALKAVADFLKEKCSAQDHRPPENPGRILQTYKFFDPDHLLPLPERSTHELARMEIMALRSYGQLGQNKYWILQSDLEALTIAETQLLPKSRDAEVIASALCTHTKRMCEQQYASWTSATSGQSVRDDALVELEWWLTNRLDVLKRARWFKEMRSQEKWAEQIRTELLGVLLSHYRADTEELRHPRGKDPGLCRKRLAIVGKRLADLCTRMGLKNSADHYAEMQKRFFDGLEPALRQDVEDTFLLSPFATHR
jgi:hypothetical protein